jgi:hypothetical protein
MWRGWPRILVAAIIVLAECFMIVRIRSSASSTVTAERNFFGTLRIRFTAAVPGEQPALLRLTHGQITHGLQYQHRQLGKMPTSYYGPQSGIDLAVRLHPRRLAEPRQPIRIGALGLGAGTIAAYTEPGDMLRFYEINPTVVEWAAGDRAYFSYVADSQGDTEVILGDARLSLERQLREGRPQQFDVLVMDAFSSDSVPVHLLSREALEIYTAHLRDEHGIIAMNISNRFLDFRDLIASEAAEAGYTLRMIDLTAVSLFNVPSRWALLCRDPEVFQHPEFRRRLTIWFPRRRVVWTDSFSNLFQLLR